MSPCIAIAPDPVGGGFLLRHGVADSPFGHCFVAGSEAGICRLAFLGSDDEAALQESALRTDWPEARLVRDDRAVAAWMPGLFQALKPALLPAKEPLRVVLRGTAFRRQVWAALLAIPPGEVRTYTQVAAALGRPEAVRAVASAIARNDIAWLVPCHRVVPAGGGTGQYRWGADRKRALLAWEAGEGAVLQAGGEPAATGT